MLGDFSDLLSAAIKPVDAVLHFWKELSQEERNNLAALAPEAGAMARRIESVAGRLPPRGGPRWDDEDDPGVVDLRLRSAKRGHGETEGHAAESGEWVEKLAANLGPLRSAIDVPDLYARVAHATATTLAADACVISTYDAEHRVLRDVAGSTPGDASLNIVVEEYAIDDFPVTKRVLEEGGCIEISLNDPAADDTERQLLQHLGFARVLICSFALDDDHTRGAIEVYRHTDRPFRQDDPRRVEAITQLAAGVHARITLSERLQENFTKTIEALTSAVEARHAETQEHTQRIRDVALALSDALKLSPDARRRVQLGAILHDVGKIGVPDAILLKPGPLDEEEWRVMQAHTEIGTKLLSGIDFLQPALPVVRHHHERWDGSGYPAGLRGDEIPVEARIVALCDAFDAMTSDRPYRPAISVESACNEIASCSGTHFDPEMTTLLVAIVKSMGTEDLGRKFVRYAV